MLLVATDPGAPGDEQLRDAFAEPSPATRRYGCSIWAVTRSASLAEALRLSALGRGDEQWLPALGGLGELRLEGKFGELFDSHRRDRARRSDSGEQLDVAVAVRAPQFMHVLDAAQYGDLVLAQHRHDLLGVQMRRVVRSDDDQRSRGAQQENEMLQHVGRPWPEVGDQVVKLPPLHLLRELVEHEVDRRCRKRQDWSSPMKNPADITFIPKTSTGSIRAVDSRGFRYIGQLLRCCLRVRLTSRGMSGA